MNIDNINDIRKKVKTVKIGNVLIGGNNPVSIQSMTNTDTRNIKDTVEQIKSLEDAGVDIVRLAALDIDAAKAIKEIKKQTKVNLIADINFDYRFCPLNMPFFWAEFKLNFGFDILKDEALKNARSNQPSGASFGSIFKNPKNDFAGRLIEAVGLKGFSKGDAMLSDKHANFLINKKNASFEDAFFLIELARKKVFEEFGINLENEVIII